MEDHAFAEVAITGKVNRLLTYRIPESLRGQVRVGCAVGVPLRTRQVTGFVVSTSAETEIKDIKEIASLLDPEPVLSDQLLQLGRWMSGYYVSSVGEILRRALPPGMARATRSRVRVVESPSEEELGRWRSAHPVWAKVFEEVTARPGTDLRELGRKGRGYVSAARRLAAKGFLEIRQELAGRALGPRRRRTLHPLLEPHELRDQASQVQRRAPKLARCLEVLADSGEDLSVKDLGSLAGATSDTIRRLVNRGWVGVEEEMTERRARVAWEPDDRAGYPLTEAQQVAEKKIAERLAEEKFRTVLLHGVTGSGKTEIYLRAIDGALRSQRKALVLVPEISLAAQTVGRVRERFGDGVEVYHSALSPGERRDSWHRIRRGEVNVVVGARSAVFAPLDPLGLIVVDEEHEPAFKEPESPRYHARDVALVRAKLAGALVILSTATPSFETYHNALKKKYECITLGERVEGRRLPPVQLVDLRNERRGQPRILSVPLRRRIEESLGRREQVMLFLNRRSFAPHVQCPACGLVFCCTLCDVALAYHAREREMKCHLCGESRPAVERCPHCGEKRLHYSGVGTQRVERELKELFPAARVVRMDLDTTQRAGAHGEIIEQFRKRQIDILLGTQMIAKGLDFPRVSLVGVINADTALNLPDFRASERTFDLLTQVAGRTGRGDVGGEVLIQTYLPSHASLQCAKDHDYLSFYTHAVEARKAAGYPPWTRLIRIVCEGPEPEVVSRDVDAVAGRLKDELKQRRSLGTNVLGPAPAGFPRRKGKYRWHLIVKSTEPSLAREALRSTLEAVGRGRSRIIVDVDPQDMM